MVPHPKTAPAAQSDISREAWTIVIQLFKAAKQHNLASIDMPFSQAQLLLQLDPDRPMPMIEIANTLGCDASNVTGLVDRLEERALIERRTDTDDRRVKMIGVTAAGKKLRAKLLDLWYSAPEGVAKLPQKDLKELLRILRKAAGE